MLSQTVLRKQLEWDVYDCVFSYIPIVRLNRERLDQYITTCSRMNASLMISWWWRDPLCWRNCLRLVQVHWLIDRLVAFRSHPIAHTHTRPAKYICIRIRVWPCLKTILWRIKDCEISLVSSWYTRKTVPDSSLLWNLPCVHVERGDREGRGKDVCVRMKACTRASAHTNAHTQKYPPKHPHEHTQEHS